MYQSCWRGVPAAYSTKSPQGCRRASLCHVTPRDIDLLMLRSFYVYVHVYGHAHPVMVLALSFFYNFTNHVQSTELLI